MTDVSRLGGGYATSQADPHPTIEAVIAATKDGDREACLVVVAGPPGVGKSTVCVQLLNLLPGSLLIDKDWCAGPFILEAARQSGVDESDAYGTGDYWRRLRPLEYSGAVTTACANLRGRRTVLLTGGWGPELSVESFWLRLTGAIAPARLVVLHLDAPDLISWRQRMVARGSRDDLPWFDTFAAAVTRFPVWSGAHRLKTNRPLAAVVQDAIQMLRQEVGASS
ncbi:MAG: hypothetical protein VX733_06240 [Candidatus Latescibacterota bacterium]|nr:hypothetical protein [Candidatus Latescibacterota bacterium]